MSLPFPEPMLPHETRTDVLLGYLNYFRARLLDKVTALPPLEQRTSRLSSGWTPLELVRHLTFVERRWLVWGFEGQDIGDPWGDQRDGHWFLAPDEDSAEVLAALVEQGRRSAQIVAAHDLAEMGAPGPRWRGQEPASLERVLLHLVQEHARHLGQLDVVVELASGATGE